MHHSVVDDSSSWSDAQWTDWIAQRVHDRETIFTAEPAEMVAAYNREVSYTRDYHSRELLELLQNADDAGVGYGHCRVIIMLTHDGLCVGNTGIPFSAEGVRSLMISDKSPKQLDRTRYIGNRGLGFRSILSWTHCPFVLSGNLALGFDRERAQTWLEQLCEKNTRVKAEVEAMRNAGVSSPIPILAVPAMLNCDGDVAGMKPNAATFPAIWSLASRLRAEGYNTIVAISFTQDGAFEEVQSQIGQMGKEVLLFVKNIRELVIQTPTHSVTWRVAPHDDHDDIIRLSSNEQDAPCQEWRIFKKTDAIPSQFLRSDQQATPGYEITLAIPKDGSAPSVLFNYFPTQVRFPFLFVAHATLELTNNRQNLVESDANRFIVRELAELIAEAAEKSHDRDNPWRPLSLIAARGDIDPVLANLGFSKALIESAKTRSLIPVRGGQLLKPTEALRIRENTGSWLPKEEFEDIVLSPDDEHIRNILEKLVVNVLDENALRQRLNRLSPKLSIPDRAALIAGLVKTRLLPADPPPSLLIDDTGEVIPSDYETFLPPTDGESFHLPSWMTLRTLHRDFANALQSELGVRTLRHLVSYLSAFHLREYALIPLTSEISAKANDKVKEDPEHEKKYRIEALKAIFDLYSLSGEDDTFKPQNLRVQLPTRKGGFAPANSLYFGQEYSCGILTDALYGQVCPELIVAGPSDLQLDGDIDRIGRFIRWLGVSDRPRVVSESSYGYERFSDYSDYVKTQLSYPITFNPPDVTINSPEDLSRAYYWQLSNVSSIDQLTQIIKLADPHAILAWIAVDDRLEEWRSHGDRRASLRLQPGSRYNYRVMQGQIVPSYVTWLLEHSPWLPASNGQKAAPNQCTLARNLPDDVKTILPRPAVNQRHEIFKSLGIDKNRLQFALQRVGVSPALDDLSWDEFYTLLLDLPQRDPDGKTARSLYRALITRSEGDEPPSEEVRQKFVSTGKMLGRRNETTHYFSVNELYYVDNATLPDIVCREIPLLELNGRRGAQKVQRLFGVAPLDNRGIELVIESHDLNPRAPDLASEVDRLKPYIYAMRIDADSDGAGQSRLKKLEIKLCRSVEGKAKVGDRKIPISLRAAGELIVDGDTAYLVAEPDDSDLLLKDELIADAVGEIFADVFRVESGSDFARLASCQPPRRLALLERILGHDAQHLLKQARTKLEMKDEEEENSEEVAGWVEPPRTFSVTKTEDGQRPPTEGKDTLSGDGISKPVGTVQVEESGHTPLPPPHTVRLRVRITPSTSAQKYVIRQVADPVRCQEVALRFEEAEGQNRFPLPVDHLQGTEAYGCDILSFATEEDREKFKHSPDLSLVERFIEVKGSSVEKGKVELKGNELQAAREHREKFYIYRVYVDDESGEFQVMVLNDPTATTHNIIHEIDLFREPRAKRWHVSKVPDLQDAEQL